MVANLKHVARKIKDYHDRGAVYWSGEATDSWGPAGLGMYMAARCMWDVNLDVDGLVDDFLTRAFRKAKAPMAQFYKMIDGGKNPLISKDLIGRMYRSALARQPR